MDEGTDRDPSNDPIPYLANDLFDRIPACFEPIYPGNIFRLEIDLASADIANPFLQPAFQMEAANDPARDDSNGQAESEIGQCHAPTDEREQQAECHLIDHGRSDQE